MKDPNPKMGGGRERSLGNDSRSKQRMDTKKTNARGVYITEGDDVV